MKAEIQEPVQVKDDTGNGSHYKHPAYGQVSASRISGYRDNLFGSSVKHHGWVRLSIAPAQVIKRDVDESVHGSLQTMIEVDMTEAQWVGLISRMNTSGVPCTVVHTRNDDGTYKMTPQLPPQTVGAEKMDAQVALSGAKLDAHSKATMAELAKYADKLGKRDGEAFLKTLGIFVGNYKANAEYYQERLVETKEKMVNEAKTEIEAHVHGVVTRLGLKSMADLAKIAYQAQKDDIKLIGNEEHL